MVLDQHILLFFFKNSIALNCYVTQLAKNKQTMVCFLQSTVHILHNCLWASLIILTANCKKLSLIQR